MKTVLTIAGSDPSGGAGIQADLKTFAAHRLYGMSVITSLTAQNTMGVTGVHPVPADFLAAQLTAVLEDIPPDAIKIGMLPDAEATEVIADTLAKYPACPVVLDPVMVSTSGHRLMEDESLAVLKKRLLPFADVITPNLPEAEVLLGREIHGEEGMVAAARELFETYGVAVLIKGGHGDEKEATDVLYDGEAHFYRVPRLDNPNTHGTGCTLSSAIACNLAKRHSLPESIRLAKEYLTAAIARNLSIGHGAGPLAHYDMDE